jgi:hypothetical protein
MPRPTRQPLRSEVAIEDLPAYDRVVKRAADPDRQLFVLAQQASGTAVPVQQDAGYYGRLLHSPQMAYHLSELGRLVRQAGDREDSYSHFERELVDQVLSELMDTNVIQPHHLPDAVAAGIPVETIEAIRDGRDGDLSAEERALAEFIRAVYTGTVTDAQWNALEQGKGERWMVDYAIFILFLGLTMRLQQAVGLVDPTDEEMDQLIEQLRTGERAVGPFLNRAG